MKKPKNNCTTDKFKFKNCMGLWNKDKVCTDTDCPYNSGYKPTKHIKIKRSKNEL